MVDQCDQDMNEANATDGMHLRAPVNSACQQQRNAKARLSSK